MSARDDLDQFDAQWERHREWRKGTCTENGQKTGQERNSYVDPDRRASVGGHASIRLVEIPERVRTAVLAELEAWVVAFRRIAEERAA